jgi:hypothetical protein
MWDNLMMATLSSLCPPIGLIGSIAGYIASDEPNAGKRFLVDLATMNLPGGFVKDFLVNAASDVFFGNEMSTAVHRITPYNPIILECFHCGKSTHYYVRKGGRVVCSDCLKNDIRGMIRHNDKVYVLREGVYRVHRELDTRRLEGKVLYGRTLNSRRF